jgi:DNA-directed RNA polymerase specialized sigma24 family protein
MNDTPLSLLERLRNSPDDSSWQRLTDLYLPLVGRWLSQQKLSPADADDLTQDILLVIVRELSGFDHSGRKGAFRTWLRRITVHRLRGFWRSKQFSPDQNIGALLDQLEDPASDLSQLWDKEHDEFIIRRLLELIEPEFSPSAWHAFHRQTVDGLLRLAHFLLGECSARVPRTSSFGHGRGLLRLLFDSVRTGPPRDDSH